MDRIVDQLCRVPLLAINLLVINGMSGSGKTSLLRAGVMPRLKALGHRVVYASILDRPCSDVIRAIENLSPLETLSPATDIVSALDLLYEPGHTAPVDLIVDQLERCFTLSAVPEERDRFWHDIARIMGGASKVPLNLVMSVRADWLYAFQTVNLLSNTVLFLNAVHFVKPLSPDQARAAFIGPLSAFQISFDPDVIDKIIDDLTVLEKEKFVRPPQLQIVGAALYDHLRVKYQANVGLNLSMADYEDLQGASTILRQHLLRIIELPGPKQSVCWQILFKLINCDNTRASRHEDELRGNLSEEDFHPVINTLVSYALVVRDPTQVYLLAHDYLVGEIKNHIDHDHNLQALRNGEHYLDAGLLQWKNARDTDADAFIPLESERYQYIWENKGVFEGISAEACLYLTQSALCHGHASFAYWFARLPGDEKSSATAYLSSLLMVGSDPLVETRLKAVATAVTTEMSASDRSIISESLWSLIEREDVGSAADEKLPSRTRRISNPGRVAATRILWPIRRDLAFHQQAKIARILAGYQTRRHRTTLAAMVAGAALLSLFLLAGWAIRTRVKITW